jgi:hypothetical protein
MILDVIHHQGMQVGSSAHARYRREGERTHQSNITTEMAIKDEQLHCDDELLRVQCEYDVVGLMVSVVRRSPPRGNRWVYTNEKKTRGSIDDVILINVVNLTHSHSSRCLTLSVQRWLLCLGHSNAISHCSWMTI